MTPSQPPTISSTLRIHQDAATVPRQTGHPRLTPTLDPDKSGDISGRAYFGEAFMADSVYKIVELVGTSEESWEKAATAAVNKAAESLRELRIAKVTGMDLQIEDGKVRAFRTKVELSFKFDS